MNNKVYDSFRERVELSGKWTPKQVMDACEELIKRAENKGFSDVELIFESRMCHYDDILEAPRIAAYGWRDRTDEEVAEDELDAKVTAFAEKTGMKFYDARVVLKNIDTIREALKDE